MKPWPVLVALGLTIAVLDQAGPAAPAAAEVRVRVRNAIRPAEAALGPVRDALRTDEEVVAENRRLRAELAGMQAALAATEASEARAQRLERSRGLPVSADLPRRIAGVASVAGSTFTIDRGVDDGVGTDMPVVAGGVLVGRVAAAGVSSSTVAPVTGPAFAVGVRLPDGEIGVATGLRLEMLAHRGAPRAGALAVTSGLRHSRFPAGLPVGRVAPGGGHLEPLFPNSRLETVEVLLWRP